MLSLFGQSAGGGENGRFFCGNSMPSLAIGDQDGSKQKLLLWAEKGKYVSLNGLMVNSKYCLVLNGDTSLSF